MTVVSNILYAISLISLAHAGYSAMEFTSFAKIAGGGAGILSPALPLDIKLETIMGIILFCFAIVKSQKPNLMPASYSAYSGQVRKKLNDDTFPNILHRPNFVSFENARNTLRKKSLAEAKN